MVSLSAHWVWAPLRGIGIPGHLIDHLVIHVGGFVFDSAVGFLLLCGRTRPLAFLLATFFNCANSQMFSIGMFPWVMLAVMPIFCSPEWPLVVGEKVSSLRCWTKKEEKQSVKSEKNATTKVLSCQTKPQQQNSKKLVYFFGTEFRWRLLFERLSKSVTPTPPNKHPSEQKMASRASEREIVKEKNEPLSVRQQVTLFFLLLYVTVQLALPFAHPLLPGYSTWTDGPYGTNWDMMVHNWQQLHTRVTVQAEMDFKGSSCTNSSHNPSTTLYLNPENWSLNGRWAHHADMAVQFGKCVEARLQEHFHLRSTAVYLDVWSSLNGRFTQRMYRPGVNLLTVEWSPFESPKGWVMPILGDSELWRGRMEALDKAIAEQNLESVNASTSSNTSSSFLLYIADEPGKNI